MMPAGPAVNAALPARRAARAMFVAAAGLLFLVLLLVALAPEGDAIVVQSGNIALGIGNNGELTGGPATMTCAGAALPMGIRYLPTNCDGISNGCECEGWGVAYNNGNAGFANISTGTGFSCGGGTTTSLSTFDTALFQAQWCSVRVTHDFHPSITPNLYEVRVVIENIGGFPINNILYRRVMDWDVQPSQTNERVTIEGLDQDFVVAGMQYPPALIYSHTNGFTGASPLMVPPSGSMNSCQSTPYTASIPTAPPVIDYGPCDHGSLFDFNLGALAPGGMTEFMIYYGAAANETEAVASMAEVGAQFWSLGQTASNPNTSNTFIFAFGSLPDPLPPMPPPPPPAPNTPPQLTFSASSPGTCLDSAWDFFGNVSDTGPDGDGGTNGYVVEVRWDFGDGTPPLVGPPNAPGLLFPGHNYVNAGTYTVTFSAEDDDGLVTTDTYDVDTIGDPDCCPTIDAHSVVVVFEGQTVLITLTGTDPERLPLRFRADTVPVGATLTSTGRFTWDTGPGDLGDYILLFTAEDDAGCTASYLQRIRVQAAGVGATDRDYDGLADEQDNCASAFNPGQEDEDGDGLGDACSLVRRLASAANVTTNPALDVDRDGIEDVADDCPRIPDPMQIDLDEDGLGDLCDNDQDGDGVPETAVGRPDNCPRTRNPGQRDLDGDGIGDACAAPSAWGGITTPLAGQVTDQDCPDCSTRRIAVAQNEGTPRHTLILGTVLAVAIGVTGAVLAVRIAGRKNPPSMR